MKARFRISLLLLLSACSPPNSSKKLDATLDGAVVIEAAPPDDDVDVLSWGLVAEAANAPRGEYFLFESDERPTSDSELAAFDVSRCEEAHRCTSNDCKRHEEVCTVDGLGILSARATLDSDGKLELSSSLGGATQRYFFTIVRRDVGAAASVQLRLKVGMTENSGGCGNPDPPLVAVSVL